MLSLRMKLQPSSRNEGSKQAEAPHRRPVDQYMSNPPKEKARQTPVRPHGQKTPKPLRLTLMTRLTQTELESLRSEMQRRSDWMRQGMQRVWTAVASPAPGPSQ